MISYSDRSDPSSVLSTAASEGWSSTTQRQDHTSGMYPSRVPKVSTTTGWMGSSSITPEDDPPGLGSVPPTQHLGTRARPSSYGRSNTWKPEQISSTPSMMSNGFETKETGWNVNAELHRPDVSGKLLSSSKLIYIKLYHNSQSDFLSIITVIKYHPQIRVLINLEPVHFHDRDVVPGRR